MSPKGFLFSKTVLQDREPILRYALMALAGILAVFYVVSAAVRPRGDFLVHMEFGRRLWQGEFLYAGGTHIPYPPFWAFVHAPLSLLPVNVAMPLVTVLGLAALAALIRMVQTMADPFLSLDRKTRFWVLAGTLLVSFRFITRDLADGGQNIILLTLAWAGLWLFSLGRTFSAAASLGLAIALKCTPLAFVVWFAWKRRWAMAALSLAWAGIFSLMPVLTMGPASYVEHVQVWVSHAVQGVTSQDPSLGVLGEEKFQNKALRPSLARYLMHLPEGHAGRYSGAGYGDFLNLDPATANTVIRGITLLLLLAFGWACRHPLRTNHDPAALWGFAAVGVLMPVLSPIAWGQHCVVVFPALYLLTRAWVCGDLRSPVMRLILIAIAFLFIFTSRFFLGKELSLLLESYHLIPVAMLLLCGLTLVAGQKLESAREQERTMA